MLDVESLTMVNVLGCQISQQTNQRKAFLNKVNVLFNVGKISFQVTRIKVWVKQNYLVWFCKKDHGLG